MQVLERIKAIAEPLIKELDCEIIDMTYRREGGAMVLRLLVDKPGGIKLDECKELNNRLSATLEKENIIDEYYIIEVSSPGLDRPLETKEDFKRALGRPLRVTTYALIDEKNRFEGSLLGLGEKEIVLEEKSGVSYQIPLDKIASAKLLIEF